jgi:tetratricopeptide (TPR) repeat protein
LSDEKPNDEAEAAAEQPAGPGRLRSALAFARHAAVHHWKRTLAAAVTLVLLLAGIAFMWTYTAELAIDAERAKIAAALAALDKHQFDKARVLVREVLGNGALPREELGGPLFVLGAVKTYDASIDTLPDRRRTDYLVASRYLRESQAYGFVPGREKHGLLLLGMSLIESRQFVAGIEVLSDALKMEPTAGGPINAAIHRMLAQAYTQITPPDYGQALAQAEIVLADESVSPDDRLTALMLKAKVLGKLHRHAEAQQSFAMLPREASRQADVLLAHGQTLLDAAQARAAELPPTSDGKLPPELTDQVDDAVAMFNDAQSLDAEALDVVRQSLYLMGRAAELSGERRDALRLYSETYEQFGDTPEGLAAKLAAADLMRADGDDKEALVLYRQVLQEDLDPASYRNEVMPLDEVRQRIMGAVNDFVDRDRFKQAMVLLDRFLPLFSSSQELVLRGQTLRDWGDRQIRDATGDTKDDAAQRRAGRRRLREAGMAFERLAVRRFTTSYYPDDLWESADCYFRGQSYSSATRVLDLYLKNEPERRNAQALLRLGQSNLALGRLDECISALEECIELYGRDNATYQARIDCARAYLYQGNPEKAESLLRYNLTQSNLKPSSPEWRDSLFALGRLLFDLNRHEDAIGALEEAVERYPTDPDELQARYLIGESYRRWAAEPLERLVQARTASEREKNQRLVDERLGAALANFKEVQSRITLQIHNVQEDPLHNAMRRNCYMLEGAVLFDLGRYQQAIEAYQNVSSLYPNEPFVLETFLQIAHCWQRMNRPENARGAVQQAKLTLEQLPSDADFLATTAFTRDEWKLMLTDMAR